MIDRIVRIEGYLENGELAFSSEQTKDSEALHELLCRIAPGDQYSVIFERFVINCAHYDLKEVGMTGCGYNCKIYRCEKCGTDYISHSRIYGCPQAN